MAEKHSRRQFLEQAALASGALVLGGRSGFAAKPLLPNPRNSGIDHIVVATMENRSFDHLLGWLPGADGQQAGLAYLDGSGVSHTTHPLAPDYQGCGHPDPDHSYAGGRVEYNGGACDGWLRAGSNDEYAIGYYGKATFPSSLRPLPAGRRSIATFPRSWDRLFPTGFTCTRRRPTGCRTRSN
jgi:phospholipase C